MASIFLRKYKLTICNNTEVIEKIKQEPIISPVFIGGVGPKNISQGSRDTRTIAAGENARVFSELGMEAEISYGSNKTKSSNQDATIKIYNLSKDNQKFIKSNYFIFLEAGYSTQNDLPLIFTGQIIKADTTKEKNGDVVTKILCQDGGTPSGNIRQCLSYAKGMSYINIIQDMLNKLSSRGVPTGHFITNAPFKSDKIIAKAKNGYVSYGKLIQEIIDICESLDYRAYISLGKIYVEPKFLPPTTAVLNISGENIKSIHLEEDSSGNTLNSSSENSGLKLVSFLDGRVEINQYARILKDDITEEYAGIYKVREIKHTLSYEGESWDTELSLVKGAP